MKPPSRMLTSIISSVAIPDLPAAGTPRAGSGGRYPDSASPRAVVRATWSSS